MNLEKPNSLSSAHADLKFRRGITLIEMLIGIGIFSIIAASLYMIFTNGISFNRKVKTTESLYQDVRVVADILTSDLENMVAYHQTMDYGKVQTVRVKGRTQRNVNIQTQFINDHGPAEARGSFKGEKESLALVLPTDTGLKQIRYYLAEPEDVQVYKIIVQKVSSSSRVFTGQITEGEHRMVLIREEGPFPEAEVQTNAAQSQAEILSQNVLSGSLKFLFAKREGQTNNEPIAWQERWDEVEHPLGLQMEIAFVSPEAKPEILRIRKKIFVPIGLKADVTPFAEIGER